MISSSSSLNAGADPPLHLSHRRLTRLAKKGVIQFLKQTDGGKGTRTKKVDISAPSDSGQKCEQGGENYINFGTKPSSSKGPAKVGQRSPLGLLGEEGEGNLGGWPRPPLRNVKYMGSRHRGLSLGRVKVQLIDRRLLGCLPHRPL